MNNSRSEIEVVGLGQCSLDILGQVDVYPELDQKAELDSLLVQGGGPVATALVTLARLGVATAFVGSVGDDEFGSKIRHGLIDEGVDCRFLKTRSDTSSQVAFIAVDNAGHRNIFWHRGAAAPEVPADFEAVLTSGVRVLHLDGLHQDAARQAASLARKAGVTTVLDAGTYREGGDELLPFIDHLVVSERFALTATGKTSPTEALEPLAVYGAEAITITSGKQGSVSFSAGEVFCQPAFDVEVVDTTGCGDVFHGGYILGLLHDWSLPQRVRFASACAALKARCMGGRTAIPALEQVEEFLNRHDES